MSSRKTTASHLNFSQVVWGNTDGDDNDDDGIDGWINDNDDENDDNRPIHPSYNDE